MLRKLTCWMMIAVFPAALMAADSGAAMLHSRGTAWLNGSTVPRTSAIFPGDLVQTQANSVVNINSSGSNVMVLSDSLVKYEGNAVSVEHGRVSVATSKGMATRAGDVMVAPTSSNWTEFDVTDVDGRVQVVARKGDVSISDGGQSTTLPQGQEATRDESNDRKKEKRRQGAAAPAGAGGWLDSPWAIGIGAGAVGGVVLWVLLEDQQPFSPAKP
ncbi:MAG: FecR family protein [Acidobacteriia bacterium]|nr:FecR family protein [Terriglobia bacterium]